MSYEIEMLFDPQYAEITEAIMSSLSYTTKRLREEVNSCYQQERQNVYEEKQKVVINAGMLNVC